MKWEILWAQCLMVMFNSCLLNELMFCSWYNINIQILILPYVNKYVIWALMGWTLRWSDYGWWSVLKTNMYILMAWCRALTAPVRYQWSCCDLALSRRSLDISTRTYTYTNMLIFYMYMCMRRYMKILMYIMLEGCTCILAYELYSLNCFRSIFWWKLIEAEWNIYASVSWAFIWSLILAWQFFCTKSLSDTMFVHFQLNPNGPI